MATTHTWDPQHYLTYADERGRPFVELVARIDAADPRTVVDLGCGPGNLTRLLAERWPVARVLGVDSSPEMVAAGHDLRGVELAVGDLRTWEPTEPVDVLVSNATLQWVPGHLDLLPRLAGHVAPGGWLALQVPGNLDAPSHTTLRDLADEEPFAELTADVPLPAAHDAATYLDALVRLGCEVDAWETTYLHVLDGEDPVFTWISGTAARPMVQGLPEDLRGDFETELKRRLREAYPVGPAGVVLPFRRVFVVARVPG